MALSKLFKKEPSETGNAKNISPLFVLGIILVLVGIGLSIYTVGVGPWI